MTAYVVTTYSTTLDFPTLLAFDAVSITAIGGIFAPTTNLAGGGNNIISIAGTVELNTIALFGDDSIRIAASGSVYTGSFSAAISTGSGGGSSVVENAGTITSAWGEAVFASGAFDSIRNAGQMSGYQGVRPGSDGDSNQSLLNSGQIYGTSQAVSILGSLAKVINTGVIESGHGAAISVYGEFNGATSQATQQVIANLGTITTASDYGIYVALNLTDSMFSLTNSGTIFSRSFALISLGQSDDVVVNTGTIMGAVDLGDGDDRYKGQGGMLSGTLVLGNGNDVADLRQGIVAGGVAGGAGYDTYYLSDSATVLIEYDDQTTDTVFAACNYRLAAHIETLTLLDGGAYSGDGNSAANLITGNASANRLTGLDGLDTVPGGLGDDRILGGTENDVLNGDAGDDAIKGGSGNDTLRGGDEDDVLTGGEGRDNLGGDAGAAVFVFARLAHSGTTATKADSIVDFTSGDALTDLSRIDARSTNPTPNDAFTFIGSAAFSNVAGQLRFSVVGTYVLVEMDVNGDSVVDSAIRLNGLTGLNASDFVL